MSRKLTEAPRALLGAALLLASLWGASSANAKELSDRSVKVLMNYAWAILPSKFTAPNGKVIRVDKTKRKDIIIPLDVAKRIVKVGRLSAHAQICDLSTAQSANFKTLMRKELGSKKWSEQQMLYISQLHLFTVMWLTGNVKLVEKDGNKEVVLNDKADKTKTQSCTKAEKLKVFKQIQSYVCRENAGHVIGCK